MMAKANSGWIDGALSPDFEDADYPNRYIIAVQAGPDPVDEETVHQGLHGSHN